MSKYDDLIRRFEGRYGDDFDRSELEAATDILHWYKTTSARVKVEGPMGTRFGRISTTTGWRPAFLLMHRSSDMGSWDILGPNDRVVAVQVNGTYRSVVAA